MEIVVKRIAKKKTYTIGHLYILNDKDVKRTWRSGVKIGDKRIFEHSFDKAKLDKEHYFCDTLGCILVGENKLQGAVFNSRIWLHRLMNAITAAREREESVWITII